MYGFRYLLARMAQLQHADLLAQATAPVCLERRIGFLFTPNGVDRLTPDTGKLSPLPHIDPQFSSPALPENLLYP